MLDGVLSGGYFFPQLSAGRRRRDTIFRRSEPSRRAPPLPVVVLVNLRGAKLKAQRWGAQISRHIQRINLALL